MFAHVCSFLLLWVSCQAYVDQYKWKNQEALDTLNSISKKAFSFDDKRDELLATYSGEAAEACKEKLSKEEGYEPNSAIIQAKLYSVNGMLKEIDMSWYNATQACDGDQTCVKAAAKEGRKELHNVKVQQLTDINAINARYLEEVKTYIENCLSEEEPQSSSSPTE